jgi:hypothetical protein
VEGNAVPKARHPRSGAVRVEEDPNPVGFSPGSLFANVVVSAFGAGIFVYGRKQRRWPRVVIGVVLMVFPYLVDGAALMLSIAAALLVALWLATHCRT